MRTARTLLAGVAVVIAAALLCMFLIARMDNTRPAGAQDPPADIGEALAIERESDGTTCEEDEPCWECDSMGNLICGPTPVRVEPGYTG